jgi:hypothetical protein
VAAIGTRALTPARSRTRRPRGADGGEAQLDPVARELPAQLVERVGGLDAAATPRTMKSSCTGIGFSVHSVPSLSKTARRSGGGTTRSRPRASPLRRSRGSRAANQ